MSQFRNFTANIGNEFLYVQGAGGNISEKNDDKLCIKSSGFFMGDALNKDIFSYVSNSEILEAFKNNIENLSHLIDKNENKRPSIETYFHAILPHRYILHLHHLPILAEMLEFGTNRLEQKLSNKLRVCVIPYIQPGIKVAKEIVQICEDLHMCDAVLLKNHGVIITANNIEELAKKLMVLDNITQYQQIHMSCYINEGQDLDIFKIGKYNYNFDLLCVNSHFKFFIKNGWRITPDHIVFLGYDPLDKSNLVDKQGLYLDIERGIFDHITLKYIQKIQLAAYMEVISRISYAAEISVLSESECRILQGWEAEKFRKGINN